MNNEPIEIGRITITKVLTTDGESTVAASYSEGLSLGDALGMIVFAEHITVRHYYGPSGDE